METPKPQVPPVEVRGITALSLMDDEERTLYRAMTKKQQRRFLAQKARTSTGTTRRACLSEIQVLREIRDRLRVRYCSEPRLELATDARCQALPGVQCECGHCRHLGREWPGIYLVSVIDRDTNTRAQISYSCWLHSQSEDFLNALPSSSSIVRFG